MSNQITSEIKRAVRQLFNDNKTKPSDICASMTEHFTAEFEKNGFIVIPQAVSSERCKLLHHAALEQLRQPVEPYELESTLGYPGAPEPESHEGKTTIRRLRNAYDRHDIWRQWAHDPILLKYIRSLFGSKDISLTRAHHNCLMTKSPNWSTRTGWHQDIRYWSFENPRLITAWLSLTNENLKNGCMQVIPESHKQCFNKTQFDELQFFRDDLTENKTMIEKSLTVELNQGDLLLFDSRLLHSANKNLSDKVKVSLVFTYKLSSNKAITNTRSSSMNEISMVDKTN